MANDSCAELFGETALVQVADHPFLAKPDPPSGSETDNQLPFLAKPENDQFGSNLDVINNIESPASAIAGPEPDSGVPSSQIDTIPLLNTAPGTSAEDDVVFENVVEPAPQPILVPVWMIGIALVIAQAAFSATGLALQRYARLLDDPNSKPSMARKASAERNPTRHKKHVARLKLFGMVLYGCSQPLNAIAITLCPISVVGPLCSASIILFSIMCAGYLGEVYTTVDKIAVAMSLIGTVGIVTYSPRQDKVSQKVLDDNTKILRFWEYGGLTFYILCIIVTLFLCVRIVRKQNGAKQGVPKTLRQTMEAALAYPIMSGCLAVMSESLTKALGVYLAQGFTFIVENFFTVLMLGSCMGAVGLTCFLVVSLGAQNNDTKYFLPAYCATSSFFFGMYGLSIGEFADHPAWDSFMFGFFGFVAISSVIMSSLNTDKKDDQASIQNDSNDRSLKNVHGGRRRSVGAFQRLNTLEEGEAKQPMDEIYTESSALIGSKKFSDFGGLHYNNDHQQAIQSK